MKESIIMGLPWIMSLWSLTGSYLDGKKYKYSPLIKFFGQGLWLIWIPLTGNWGFLPLAILLTVIYYRNHLLWTKKVDVTATALTTDTLALKQFASDIRSKYTNTSKPTEQ